MVYNGYDDPAYIEAKDEFERQLVARCACFDQDGLWPEDWDEFFSWCQENDLDFVNMENRTSPENICNYKIPEDLSRVVFWACEDNPRLAFGDPRMALLAKVQLSAVPWNEYHPDCRTSAESLRPLGKWTRD